MAVEMEEEEEGGREGERENRVDLTAGDPIYVPDL